eukprot:6713278-Prymnesium_polylepis.3
MAPQCRSPGLNRLRSCTISMVAQALYDGRQTSEREGAPDQAPGNGSDRSSDEMGVAPHTIQLRKSSHARIMRDRGYSAPPTPGSPCSRNMLGELEPMEACNEEGAAPAPANTPEARVRATSSQRTAVRSARRGWARVRDRAVRTAIHRYSEATERERRVTTPSSTA